MAAIDNGCRANYMLRLFDTAAVHVIDRLRKNTVSQFIVRVSMDCAAD
jgi:hypothetical protein